MARIRTIKPEFWTDEKLSLLDPLTRLVFLGLVSLADDFGRLIDNVKSLDGALFPHTDDSVEESLAILASLSRVLRYTSASGQNLIQVVGWKAHQKVDHPGREILPAPTKDDWAKPVTGQRPIAPPRKPSRKSREKVATVSRSDLGPSDLGPSDQGAVSANRGGWVARFGVPFSESSGGIAPLGEIGRHCKPLVDRDGEEATYARWLIFCASDKRQFGAAYFAKNAGDFDPGKVSVLSLSKEARAERQFKQRGYVT